MCWRFLGMGLGVECARDLSVWGWVWNAGMECARVLFVWGWVWNARVLSRYGVRCGLGACFLGGGWCRLRSCFLFYGLAVECERVFSVWF